MPTSDFDFANDAGRQLSGTLETGASRPKAYAIFAHCFTCNKNSLAAARISRRLADQGIGVLRFDFTGLGKSEGQFGQGLSNDVQDIVCAARAMEARGMAPQLLVGHSFGGAAVLAAAGALPGIQAVAVIGAPFAAEHVLKHIGPALEDASEGRVPVSIGGREFSLGAEFVEDIRSHNQHERIAALGRALLVMHSPIDDIVSIDNASSIFSAARHPKSFVSLDNADHLLLRKEDAQYTANVIAAWARRYLDDHDEEAPPTHGVFSSALDYRSHPHDRDYPSLRASLSSKRLNRQVLQSYASLSGSVLPSFASRSLFSQFVALHGHHEFPVLGRREFVSELAYIQRFSGAARTRRGANRTDFPAESLVRRQHLWPRFEVVI